MSATKLVKQLEIAHALENNGDSPDWVWYCQTHSQAGIAPTKGEAEWLADSHQWFIAKNSDRELLDDVDEMGVPKLTLEELSQCSIQFARKGVPEKAKAFV